MISVAAPFGAGVYLTVSSVFWTYRDWKRRVVQVKYTNQSSDACFLHGR